MRPGFALPGGRAASTSSVNWGRTTTPLSEPLTLQLQALLANARGRLAAPPPAPGPAAASLAPPPTGGGAPAAPPVDTAPMDMVMEMPAQPGVVSGGPRGRHPASAEVFPPESPDAGGPEGRPCVPESPDAGGLERGVVAALPSLGGPRPAVPSSTDMAIEAPVQPCVALVGRSLRDRAQGEPERRRAGRASRAGPYDGDGALPPSVGPHPLDDGLRGARLAME
eukprot:15443481-Alexandrium_andersonii.AAC.1